MPLKLTKRWDTYWADPTADGDEWFTFKGSWGWAVGVYRPEQGDDAERVADLIKRQEPMLPIYLLRLKDAESVMIAGREHGFDAVKATLDAHQSRAIRYPRGRSPIGRQATLYAGQAECSCGWSVRNLPNVREARVRAIDHRVDMLFTIAR